MSPKNPRRGNPIGQGEMHAPEVREKKKGRRRVSCIFSEGKKKGIGGRKKKGAKKAFQ